MKLREADLEAKLNDPGIKAAMTHFEERKKAAERLEQKREQTLLDAKDEIKYAGTEMPSSFYSRGEIER